MWIGEVYNSCSSVWRTYFELCVADKGNTKVRELRFDTRRMLNPEYQNLQSELMISSFVFLAHASALQVRLRNSEFGIDIWNSRIRIKALISDLGIQFSTPWHQNSNFCLREEFWFQVWLSFSDHSIPNGELSLFLKRDSELGVPNTNFLAPHMTRCISPKLIVVLDLWCFCK